MVSRFAPGSTRAQGDQTEALVLSRLGEHGLQLVERNVELAGAELDLIARTTDGETYVFIEVRGRASDELGTPVETVDERKRRQIIRGATAWLVKNDLWERVAVRFDVVGVTGPELETPTIEWIVGAFETS